MSRRKPYKTNWCAPDSHLHQHCKGFVINGANVEPRTVLCTCLCHKKEEADA